MKEHCKQETTEQLAKGIEAYGAAMIASARPTVGDGVEPRVEVRMKDGLCFNLPWNFNIEHFDTILAVAAAARIKGREEAILNDFAGNIQ